MTGIPSSVPAGTAEKFTVEAFNANGTEDTTYSGTVLFTSSDANAQFSSNDTTLSGGSGSFTVTFETPGSQSVTATDTSNSSTTGSETGIVVTGPVAELIFIQQPSNASVNGTISPAVTVEEKDQLGNVLTSDNTGQITLTLTSSNGATLSGGGTVTVSDGVATFSNLSVNTAGTYTLTATEGGLSATSSSFTISTSSSNPNVIENFQNGLGNYYYVGNSYPEVGISTTAAHPGTATDGLYDEGDGNWYFREDSGAVINPGDTVSAWVQFAGTANGRAYLGFGTTDNGLDSVVLATEHRSIHHPEQRRVRYLHEPGGIGSILLGQSVVPCTGPVGNLRQSDRQPLLQQRHNATQQYFRGDGGYHTGHVCLPRHRIHQVLLHGHGYTGRQ